MKVALILATPGSTWGGMEKHVSDLAQELAALGHGVHVLAHSDYQNRFPDSVNFHSCPMALGRKNPWLRWKIRSILNSLRPDVVHAHGNKAAALAAKTKHPDWQTVGTIHGTKSNTRAFSTLDKVVAVSQAIYNQVESPKKYLIYNGVKRSDSTAARFHLTGSIKVVAAGRLEPVKGFDKLLQAWKLIHANFPGAHLTVFGEGSLKTHLCEQAESKELHNSVTIAGFHPNIGGILKNSDLLVISSEREGFSYTLVEALCAGCPVVSTPVSGCRELLPATALTSDTSAEAIANVLTFGLTNLEAVRESQQDLFLYAATHLTVTAMTKAILAAYQD